MIRRSWTQMVFGNIALLLLLAGCGSPQGGTTAQPAANPANGAATETAAATIPANGAATEAGAATEVAGAENGQASQATTSRGKGKDGKANKNAESGPLTWKPKRIRETIAPGETKEVKLSVTSEADLADVQLEVSEGLADVVNVEPATIPSVKANTPVEITVTLAAPAEGTSSYKGRLHAKTATGQLEKTLQIVIGPPDAEATERP